MRKDLLKSIFCFQFSSMVTRLVRWLVTMFSIFSIFSMFSMFAMFSMFSMLGYVPCDYNGA